MRFYFSLLKVNLFTVLCAVCLSVIGLSSVSKAFTQATAIALKLSNGVPRENTKLAVALRMKQKTQRQSNKQEAQATEHLEEAGRLHQQGKEQYQSAEFQAALESFQQALIIYRELSNQQGESSSLVGLASAYLGLGRYSQAIESFQQAIAIAQETSYQQAEQSSFVGLGNVYQDLGQSSQAIDNYQRALIIAQAIGHHPTIVSSLHGLGNVYFRLGQNSKAIEAYQLALDMARSIGDRQREASALGNLGSAHFRLGQYSRAIETYQQSLAIKREISDTQIEADDLNNLGNAYFMSGQYTQAIESYQQSLAISQNIGDRQGESEVLNNIGYLYFSLNSFADAESFLTDSIEVRESLRIGLSDSNQVSIFETQKSVYSILQQALIAQGKIEQAFEIAERGRARAFIELLSQRFSPSQVESQNLDSKVVSSSPNIDEIREIASDQNATLVEYSIVSREKLYVWVVQPSGEIAFRQVDVGHLDQETDSQTAEIREQEQILSSFTARTRDSLGVGSNRSAYADPTQTQLLQQSYQLLIEPISDLLPSNSNEKIVFIPHNSLFLVPFPALQDQDGKYLIEKHTILTAPSIQVLGLTQNISQQRLADYQAIPIQADSALIVGNPTMPAVPVLPGEPPLQPPPLPGAEREALEIAQIFDTEALIGSQATETAVVQQMSNARIVHLATHGFLNYGQSSEFGVRDIPGALVLAPSGEDDGLLSASEILELDLNAELVVLSACDTGRGDITGDGVIGLSRSLIAAGTPSVIVSLWQVPDDSTAMLMTEFYRQLQQNPNKAQALRQAMLATMAEHPAVRDWAAFTLIGEAE